MRSMKSLSLKALVAVVICLSCCLPPVASATTDDCGERVESTRQSASTTVHSHSLITDEYESILLDCDLNQFDALCVLINLEHCTPGVFTGVKAHFLEESGDRGIFCCDKMRKTTFYSEHHINQGNGTTCNYTRYRIVMCTSCLGIWETTYVGDFWHTHYN
jgi:hypothetical protein